MSIREGYPLLQGGLRSVVYKIIEHKRAKHIYLFYILQLSKFSCLVDRHIEVFTEHENKSENKYTCSIKTGCLY